MKAADLENQESLFTDNMILHIGDFIQYAKRKSHIHAHSHTQNPKTE